MSFFSNFFQPKENSKEYEDIYLDYIYDQTLYNVETSTKVIPKPFGNEIELQREYKIPFLFDKKYISPDVRSYIDIIRKVINFQKDKKFQENPSSRLFLK